MNPQNSLNQSQWGAVGLVFVGLGGEIMGKYQSKASKSGKKVEDRKSPWGPSRDLFNEGPSDSYVNVLFQDSFLLLFFSSPLIGVTHIISH